jgi:hypothetical protein
MGLLYLFLQVVIFDFDFDLLSQIRRNGNLSQDFQFSAQLNASVKK